MSQARTLIPEVRVGWEQNVLEAGELGLREPGVVGNPGIRVEQHLDRRLQQKN